MNDKINIIKIEKNGYPTSPPFNPPKRWPEYPFAETDESNAVYEGVRDLLIKLKLDKENYGKKDWNPLGEIITPGDDIVIKPNFVSESRYDNVDPQGIVTHASVIRPIIDYCLIALEGRGNIVIADAPQTDSNFERIKETTKIQDVLNFINENSSLKVNLLDLREECAQTNNGLVIKRFKIDGDPKGYSTIDLGDKSEFCDIEPYMNKTYGADYDFEEVRKHHANGKHGTTFQTPY